MNRNRIIGIIVAVAALTSLALFAVPLMAGGICPWNNNTACSANTYCQPENQLGCPALVAQETPAPALDCCGN